MNSTCLQELKGSTEWKLALCHSFIKVASFSLKPCKKSSGNATYFRLLLMETGVTDFVLPITFLQEEKITGCLYSVKREGKKNQLNFFILHLGQFDNCNALSLCQTQFILIVQVLSF